jgi:uncharacterized protein (TIGR03435 family)
MEALFKKPVIDQTGLTQHYRIDLQWLEMNGTDPDHTALKQALLNQLGLELAPGREAIEMLVMEKARD